MERVLEDLSFEASAYRGQTVVVDRDYVQARVRDIVANDDLSKFIL
jgi:ATP-dependent HslUV protease ATP-binding subunit HslU